MPIETVQELDDPRLDVYRGLPHSNLTRFSGRFIVEGRLLVERLLASDFKVESILVDDLLVGQLPAIDCDIPVYAVGTAALRQVVGFRFHRGMLACGKRQPERGFKEVVPAAGLPAMLLICVDIRDPTNLGGMLRCAAAFGADAALVTRTSADPFSRRVLRVSMGSVLRFPLATLDDVTDDLRSLQQDYNIDLIATVLADSAEPLDTASRPPRLGLLIGNEGEGLAPDVVACCRRRVTIPMKWNTDSLNAAVASGVFLYHFTRVRTNDVEAERF